MIRATAILTQGPAIDTDWSCTATGDTPRRALSQLVDKREFRDERMQKLVASGNVKLEVHVQGFEAEEE